MLQKQRAVIARARHPKNRTQPDRLGLLLRAEGLHNLTNSRPRLDRADDATGWIGGA
jgi:hypothetical protein